MALIVLIDDDQDILDASSLVLATKGYEVITAANLEDGYGLVKEQHPDLIIIDEMMNEPDDGFLLAKKFRREKFEIPILMFTHVSKSAGMEPGSNETLPVDDFIEKPVAPDKLIEKVEKLLSLHYV